MKDENYWFAGYIGVVVGMLLLAVFMAMEDKDQVLRNKLHTCYESKFTSIERCNQLYDAVLEWREVTR